MTNDPPPVSRPAIGFPGMPPAAVLRSAGPSGDSASRDPIGIAERRFAAGGEGHRDANGNGSRPATPDSGESRRRLHLSLSQGNGGSPGGEPHQVPPGSGPANRLDRPLDRPAPAAAPMRPHFDEFHHGGGNGNGSAQTPPIMPHAPQRASAETDDRRSRDGFIDQSLRERVESDIAAFLAAFDAALSEDSIETRAGLREATDRLLRAGARTRIELERLEARVPLPPRDSGGREQYSWRSR